MQDRASQHIEYIYQQACNGLHSAKEAIDNWRVEELEKLNSKYSENPSSIPVPPEPITCFYSKRDKEEFKELHKLLIKEKIIDQEEKDFESKFLPFFHKGNPSYTRLVFNKSLKKFIWVIDTLMELKVIPRHDLRIILPENFVNRRNNPPKISSIKQEYWEVQDLKSKGKRPDFVNSIISIFSKKSLEESLRKS